MLFFFGLLFEGVEAGAEGALRKAGCVGAGAGWRVMLCTFHGATCGGGLVDRQGLGGWGKTRWEI